MLERVAETFPDVFFLRIAVTNITRENYKDSLPQRFSAKRWPTTLFFRDGAELGRLRGERSEQALEDHLAEYGFIPKFIWRNRRIIRWSESRVGPLAHGLHYPIGVFEGIRAYAGVQEGVDDQELYLFRVEDHYRRFLNGAKDMRFEPPYTVDELIAATRELIARLDYRENLYIRPIIYRASQEIGVGPRGRAVNVDIIAKPFASYHERGEGGLRLMIHWRRKARSDQLSPRIKASAHYAQASIAKDEACEKGYDDALFLTVEGKVAEATGANIFLVKYGQDYRDPRLQMDSDVTLYTPSETDSILVGITRDSVMQLAREHWKMTTIERSIDPAEMWQADEVFLTGTAYEIAPIVEVDGRKIGNGAVGPVTAKLRELYGKVVTNQLLAPDNNTQSSRRANSFSKCWTTKVYKA